MQFNPLVSVIIPCYNVSACVEKAIRSVLEQTYTNLEIWIVDDASTDDTLEKINAFKDERIKVIAFKENTQKIGAVNNVLNKVNGQLIAFQDADDWSDPERIESQVLQFKSDPSLSVCFTGYIRSDRKKIFVPLRIRTTNAELKAEFLEFGKHKDSTFSETVCATMMITKTVLNTTCGYNNYFTGLVGEDIHWVYRILKNHRGVAIDKALYHYNQRVGSLTHKQFEGTNPKAAYTWNLLSKIIHMDVVENKDVLDSLNIGILKELELKSCEETLSEKIKALNETRLVYDNSMNYKLGKFLLTPIKLLNKIFSKERKIKF